jgi:ribose 5-phosphate isomerase B
MSKISVAVGADHGGYKMKMALISVLEEMGYDILDLGTDGLESVDYPDFASLVAGAVTDGRASSGLLVCGSGIGMSIAANRHPGIRAALCHDVTSARLSRQHNDANILVLGERLTGPEVAEQCLRIFFATEFEGGRHGRRVNKLG